MKQLAIVGALSLAACGGKVIEPSHPSVINWSTAVAVNTPLTLSTSWEGTCESSGLDVAFGAHWGGGSENNTKTCDKVEYDATVVCDDNACTSRSLGNDQIEVTPTRAGELHAHVQFDPKGLKRRKTVDVEPIQVVQPTAAAVTCNLWKDKVAQVEFQVYGQTAVLGNTAHVRIAGGPDCTHNESAYADTRGEWSCPIDALTAKLEVVGPGYTLPVNASCSLVFEPPSVAIARPNRFAYDLSSPYLADCKDDLLAGTRKGFEDYGWTIASATTTRLVATRLGKTATVTFSERTGDENRQICMSDMTTDAPAILSTREIPNDPR